MSLVPFLYRLSDAILNPIILLAIAVAFVYFAWGVFRFLSTEGKEKEEAKSNVMWTIVGIFIMVSVMGIIRFIMDSFEIENQGVEQYFDQTTE